MSSAVNKGYRGNAAEECLRVVVLMPKDEAEAVDSWGIPAGMSSRTSAVRYLLKRGLETVKAQENRNSPG